MTGVHALTGKRGARDYKRPLRHDPLQSAGQEDKKGEDLKKREKDKFFSFLTTLAAAGWSESFNLNKETYVFSCVHYRSVPCRGLCFHESIEAVHVVVCG